MPLYLFCTVKAFQNAHLLEAGVDEAGRGCLAGPVCAAAVIFPKGYRNFQLADSKTLSISKRDALRKIIERDALAWAVAYSSPTEIDKLNILWASVAAMHKALKKLKVAPEHILVDGNRFKAFGEVDHSCIVKGDAKFMSIAAASILAKTYRDARMERLHAQYPKYNWAKNKGYPTIEHREAIRRYGFCLHHRQSFRLLANEEV